MQYTGYLCPGARIIMSNQKNLGLTTVVEDSQKICLSEQLWQRYFIKYNKNTPTGGDNVIKGKMKPVKIKKQNQTLFDS